MPLYEYQCEACGRRFELIRKFSESTVDVCTLCGKGPVHRLPSSPAIQFKGSGFYITDYAKKGETGTAEKTSTEKSQDTKSDADKGGKSEAKAESSPTADSPGKSDATTKAASPPATSTGSKD